MTPPNADDPAKEVNITLITYMDNISELDMVRQTLTMTVFFEVMWHDPALTWDNSTFAGDVIFVDPKTVWRPDLALYNSLNPKDQFVDQKMKVWVHSDGNVKWVPGDTVTVYCDVNIAKYPFDTQTCSLMVGFWGHYDRHVNCTQSKFFTVITETAEWDILDTSRQRINTKHGDGTVYVEVLSITMQRKWLFHALNVLLPVLLVSALISVVFALPVQCGEKMSVSLTTFLTLAVFMTLIQDSLPSNSDTVCYLAVYLAFQLFLSVLAVFLSMVVVACHYRRQGVEQTTQEAVVADEIGDVNINGLRKRAPSYQLPHGNTVADTECDGPNCF
nr:hypothetical protein BaRGS_003829 [Batillaria attramentaria]